MVRSEEMGGVGTGHVMRLGGSGIAGGPAPLEGLEGGGS